MAMHCAVLDTPNSVSADPSKCELISDAISEVVVGAVAKLELKTVDGFDNQLSSNTEDVMAVLSGPSDVIANVSSLSNGIYAIEYVLTVSGMYSVAVSIGGNLVRGSTISVQALPADMSALDSTIDADLHSPIIAGVPFSFTIHTRDHFGNLRTSSSSIATVCRFCFREMLALDDVTPTGIHFVFSLSAVYIGFLPFWLCGVNKSILLLQQSGASWMLGRKFWCMQLMIEGPIKVTPNISDNANGTYVVDILLTITGSYGIKVLLGDVAIRGSPFAAEVAPSFTHAPSCTIDHSGT